MRKFTKEELIGEWSNPLWRFRLFENGALNLHLFESKSELKGSFKIFENFLIFEYGPIYRKGQWTARIETLEKNILELTDLTNHVGQIEKLSKTFFEKDLIKQFDFEQITGLTIQEVKKKLEITTLNLNTVKTLEGEDTGYLRHWDNDERVAVIIRKELLEKIKNNGSLILTVKKRIKETPVGHYTNLLIDQDIDPEYNERFESKSKLNVELFKDLVEKSKDEAILHEQKFGKLNHQLINYNEGDFNNHQIVIVTLKSKFGIKKYIVPKGTQLELRTQYYWINGLTGFLEDGLMQKRLVILEDYVENKINNETYYINKNLL